MLIVNNILIYSYSLEKEDIFDSETGDMNPSVTPSLPTTNSFHEMQI